MLKRKALPAMVAALLLLWMGWACGGDGGTEVTGVARVDVSPATGFIVGTGSSARYQASPVDGRGRPVPGVAVSWSVSDPTVATVDGSGLVTALASGTTTVVAEADGVSGSAAVEAWIPPEVAAYEPGVSYFGRREYVEYIPGELPVVISAPHGGSLEPGEIPDRTTGTLVTDSNTRQTLLAVRQALIDATGKAPHVVISHLRRTKLDPNREIVEAAQGNAYAENAWNEFQGFIDVATRTVADTFGSGFYIDLHGHGHPVARAELGYLLSAAQLNGSDASLDDGRLGELSSVRTLAASSSLPFSQLLRGSTSLGAYLAERDVPAVPSPSDPGPGDEPYFSGGYNTARHGSLTPGRVVSGVQIELPLPGIRDTQANREAFGRALAGALEAFMTEHYGFFRFPKAP